MKNKFVATVFLLFMFVFSASAGKKDKEDITFKVRSCGLYQSQIVSKVHENAPSGYSYMVNNTEIVEETADIPAEIGSEFGVEWQISSDKNKYITLELVWIFPEPMINENGESFNEIRRTISMATNHYGFYAYAFEKDFEVLKGEWTWQLFYEGKKVAERKFDVKDMNEEEKQCLPIYIPLAVNSFVF